MSKNLLIAFGVGVGCIALVVAGILFMQRGAHLDLPGQILKVRTAPVNDELTAVMVDFRVSNTSDYPAVVRTVRLYVEDKDGNRLEGTIMADPDAGRVFAAFPTLGQKYNPSLILKDKIPGRGTWDRMIGATFPVAEAKLQARKGMIVAIEELDGKIFELTGN